MILKRLQIHRLTVSSKIKKLTDNGIHPDKLPARGDLHDLSKFSPEELPGFETAFNYARILAKLEDISKEDIEKMKQAYTIHRQRNPHHPEHYKNIEEMKQVDIAEMVADISAVCSETASDFKKWMRKQILKQFEWNKEQLTFIKKCVKILEKK